MKAFENLLIEDIHTIIFDFDGVFTDNKVYLDKSGNELVRCDRSDGFAFDLLRRFIKLANLKINYFILSTETNPVLLSRAKKLNIKCFYGVENKLKFIKQHFGKDYKSEKKISNGIIYLGNDLNDYKAMNFCNYRVAPSDAHKKILEISTYILKAKGGEGFIREFVEKLLLSKSVDILDLI